MVVGKLGKLLLRDGDTQEGPGLLQVLLGELLHLVGHVFGHGRGPHAVALDGAGQDDHGASLVLHRRLVSGIDLHQVVPTPAPGELIQLLVAHALDEPLELGGVEEALLELLGPEGGVPLGLPVHQGLKPPQEVALLILGQKPVPSRAPDDLDHPPARTPIEPFQLLDDLGVAPHRPVQALQVGVYHEDEVVQVLPGRQVQGPHGFRLVVLPVPQEGPDLGAAPGLQTPVLQVAHEAGLVDGLDGTKAHGNRGELPEIRHQPGMGIAGKPPATRNRRVHLPAEVLQVRLA